MEFIIDGTKYEMVQDKVTFAEARAIEKQTGSTFKQIMENPDLQGSATVMQALIWVSMKRQQPDLRFSDLDDVGMDIEVIDDQLPEEPDDLGGEADHPTEPVAESDGMTSTLSD